MGGQLAGLAGRGTDVKLEQPGTQQVEPVPVTAPPQGEQAGRGSMPKAPSLYPLGSHSCPLSHAAIPFCLLPLGQHPGST